MANSRQALRRGQLGLFGVIMPGLAQVPPATLCLIAVGVVYAVFLSVARPDVLERAPALLEGEESSELDPMPAG
jgi:hypothetical protein